jgi:hypothetical protein
MPSEENRRSPGRCPIAEPDLVLSSKSAPRRAPGRPWPKGVSGNPGGRPGPDLREVREAARKLAPLAMERLGVLVRKGPAQVQLAAAIAILDRAYGKPPQALEHTGPDGERLLPEDLVRLSDVQLARVIAVITEVLDDGAGAPAGELPP